MNYDGPISSVRRLRVLLIEDCTSDAVLVLAELRRRGYVPEWQRVDTTAGFQEALAQQPWDCILSDYEMPRFSGIDAIRTLRGSGLDLPFIVVSGAIGEETAVAAMKAGAHDYVMKDNLTRLGPAIERELQEAVVREERRQAATEIAEDATVAKALHRIGHELITHLGSPTLMDSFCALTAEVLGCDTCQTLFWQPEEQVFQAIARCGENAEDDEITRIVTVPRDQLLDVLSRLGEDDVAEVDTAALDIPAAAHRRSSTQLCIALRCGQDLIGLHLAQRRNGESFGTVERRIAHGITQLASLTLEHVRVRQELEGANRLKSDFVATVSHELRTPLNIIMGYTDLFRDGEFGPQTLEGVDALDAVDKNARELLDLINSTLDLSRLDRGQLPVALELVHLAAEVTDIAAETSNRLDKQGVRLVVDVPTDLAVETDPLKLRVILKNLMSNAFKFTDRGKVTLTARAQPGGIEISVADTGIGIAPDITPIIFEPFRQGESAMTRRFGGVGLGLYVVWRLVNLLAGTIHVESEIGRGSTFRVWLPAKHPKRTYPRQAAKHIPLS